MNFAMQLISSTAKLLSSVGINLDIVVDDPSPIGSSKPFHKAKPSGQALMNVLYAVKKEDKDRSLFGAHIIAVAVKMEHVVIARQWESRGCT